MKKGMYLLETKKDTSSLQNKSLQKVSNAIYYKDDMFESICIEKVGTPGVTSAKNPAAWKNLRLEEEDIERCSIVVPDLADIRLGDLVVAFGDGKGIPTELGIVVGLPETLPVRGSDQREFLKQVVVLSVRQEFRQVTLGTWATGGSVFGGFSKAPLRAHVRRLIKRSGSPETTNDQVAWDLADYMTGSVSVKIGKMKEQSSNLKNIKERWIPNTGEYLVLDGITLERTLKVSGVSVAAPLALSTGDYEVVISGALDRGYDAAPANVDSGNIYKNTAAMFDLVLLNETTEDTKRIGTLTPKKDELGHYYIDYSNSEIYTPDGSAMVTFTNGVSTQTRIVWNDSLEIVGSNGEKLAIRPASADTARAGDDLLLQFGIRKTGEKDLLTMFDPSTGTSTPAVATAAEADYVAVYDKKMLWRANLYIAETNVQDWNDAHPWVGSANNPNEWNNPTADYNSVDGGQVVDIPAYTWPGQVNKDGTLVGQGLIPRGAFQGQRVSYDYWGTDTPTDFRSKLLQQKTFLGRLYNNQGVFQNNWANTAVPAVVQQWLQTYSPTNAATDYYNYVKVTDRPKQAQAVFPHQVTTTQQGQIGEYPYIPGFSYWYDYRNGGDNWDVSFAAAGIDCVGLVHRSIQASQAQYTGGMLFPSGTILQDSSMANYSTNSLFNWRKKPGQHSAFINVLTFRQDDKSKRTEALKKVIPGDIFYYVTDQEGNGHIGIVLSTTSTETGAEDGIRLIESVYNTKDGIRFGGVVSYRTIRNLTDDGKDWTIGRLK
jgi:hypothetical protein